MWKNIIIGSVVLFGASTYVYFANNTANVGEIACVQERFTKATNTCKEVWTHRTFKLYAEMRTEEFNQRREKFQQEKVELDAEDASVQEATAQAEATFEAAEADYKRMKEELQKLILEAAASVGMEADAVGIEEEDDLNMKIIADKIAELFTDNGRLEGEISNEKKTIADLEKQSAELNQRINDGKKLNQDRRSRISPAELSCHVSNVSANWNYVTLDAGVNKGIVIGSRLAVMRGGEKICELNVCTVEDQTAACDIVYSTLKVGETVQVGDRVEAVRNNK